LSNVVVRCGVRDVGVGAVVIYDVLVKIVMRGKPMGDAEVAEFVGLIIWGMGEEDRVVIRGS
jgi:hypothetical protein